MSVIEAYRSKTSWLTRSRFCDSMLLEAGSQSSGRVEVGSRLRWWPDT